MKRKYIYICSFFIVVAIFTLIYGLSYQKAKSKHDYSKKVDTVDATRTNTDTKFYVETYSLGNEKVTSEEDTIPVEMAGMTKDDIENYLEKVMENPPLKESLKGLLSYELISFSKQKLVVRKTYKNMKESNRYFMSIKDDEVVVYYNDLKSVYQYTGIQASSLSGDEIAKLKIGYFVKSEEEVFSILENYSS